MVASGDVWMRGGQTHLPAVQASHRLKQMAAVIAMELDRDRIEMGEQIGTVGVEELQIKRTPKVRNQLSVVEISHAPQSDEQFAHRKRLPLHPDLTIFPVRDDLKNTRGHLLRMYQSQLPIDDDTRRLPPGQLMAKGGYSGIVEGLAELAENVRKNQIGETRPVLLRPDRKG